MSHSLWIIRDNSLDTKWKFFIANKRYLCWSKVVRVSKLGISRYRMAFYPGLTNIPRPMENPLWSILLRAIWWQGSLFYAKYLLYISRCQFKNGIMVFNLKYFIEIFVSKSKNNMPMLSLIIQTRNLPERTFLSLIG